MTPAVVAESFIGNISGEQVFVSAFAVQLFNAIVPYFLASFVAFGLIRYLCFKIRLDNQEVRNAEFWTRAEYLKSIGLELVDAPRAPTG